jgi:ribosomal protein S18 acetylase RimI-like enzyme
MRNRMTGESHIQYRVGVADDSDGVAALHADSWRHHYRGAYSNAYLDGDIISERQDVWASRMAEQGEDRGAIVALENGVIVGFVYTVLDADDRWGALIDNLHVRITLKRRGIGSTLLRAAGEFVAGHRPSTGMYLWVLEQNQPAQRFYAASGGEVVERALVTPPGGDPARLSGEPWKLRYAWSDSAVLSLRTQT